MLRMKLTTFVLVASQMISPVVLASSVSGVHTWHHVNVSGAYQATLQAINEDGSFVAAEGTPLKTFKVTSNQPAVFGFKFADNADFDIAYTLTLTEAVNSFTSKACVFVVTAQGPARPDVRHFAYNGAHCEFKSVPHSGGDFYAN